MAVTNSERDTRDTERHERSSRSGGGFEEHMEVVNVATYSRPILASLRGNAVNIIATGDAPGHSPVCQCVDERGTIEWVSTNKLTVVDPHVLPPSSDQLNNLSRNFR